MFKKNRIYDIIGAIIATLLGTLIIENFKSIVNFINYPFQTRLSIAVLTISTTSFVTLIITRTYLTKQRKQDVLNKDKDIELLTTQKDEEIKRLLAQLKSEQEYSSKDRLTDAYNRNQLEKFMTSRIENAKERKQPFAGLFIDIDNFKRINDTYGHEVGDFVLQQLAKLIKPRSDEDVLIRFGGDEFWIFSKIGDNYQAGYEFGTRLKNRVLDYDFLIDDQNQKREKMTISCGVTEFDIEKDTAKSFKERLSQALNQAKRNPDGSAKKNFVAVIDTNGLNKVIESS
jgi:diguanylate cyclase (GGDEF)-like protein